MDSYKKYLINSSEDILDEDMATKFFKSVEDLTKHIHKSADKLQSEWNKVSKKVIKAIVEASEDEKANMPKISCHAEVDTNGLEAVIAIDYSKLTKDDIRDIIKDNVTPLLTRSSFYLELQQQEALLIMPIVTTK